MLAPGLVAIHPSLTYAQELCLGDVNGDGQVTEADVETLLPVLFQGAELDPEAALRADANSDAVLNAADIAAIIQLDGFSCITPTGGPQPTATPTPGGSPLPTDTVGPVTPSGPTATP